MMKKASQNLSDDKARLNEKLKDIQERQNRWRMEERAEKAAKASIMEKRSDNRPLSATRSSVAAKSKKQTNDDVLLWTTKNPEIPPDNFVVRNKNKSSLSSARSQKSTKSTPSSSRTKKGESLPGKSDTKNKKEQFTSTPEKIRNNHGFKAGLEEELSAIKVNESREILNNVTMSNNMNYDSEKYAFNEAGDLDTSVNGGELLKNTDQVVPKTKSTQFAMHCCPKCKQLMTDEDHTPYLIIPCGHNICKQCLPTQIDCFTCQSRVASTLKNAMLSQVIMEHKKEEEKQELARKEEYARKYVTEYDSLKTRYQVLSYKAESVIENMEDITKNLVDKKSCMKEIEENGRELRSQMQRMQQKLNEYENHYGVYHKECEELEYKYQKEKENLDLLENTLQRVKQSKERVKTLIHNFIPSFQFQDNEES